MTGTEGVGAFTPARVGKADGMAASSVAAKAVGFAAVFDALAVAVLVFALAVDLVSALLFAAAAAVVGDESSALFVRGGRFCAAI